MKLFPVCVVLSVVLVTGCVPSKPEINAKLVKGCAEAVKYMLTHIDSDYKYVSVESHEFERAPSNKNIRIVKLNATVLYQEFAEEEQTYICSFNEAKNIFNYRADIGYVEVEEKKYGRIDGTLKNLSISEFSIFNEAVRQVVR